MNIFLICIDWDMTLRSVPRPHKLFWNETNAVKHLQYLQKEYPGNESTMEIMNVEDYEQKEV